MRPKIEGPYKPPKRGYWAVTVTLMVMWVLLVLAIKFVEVLFK